MTCNDVREMAMILACMTFPTNFLFFSLVLESGVFSSISKCLFLATCVVVVILFVCAYPFVYLYNCWLVYILQLFSSFFVDTIFRGIGNVFKHTF